MAAPALAALTGEIRRGCITGLVGPDGAGKTTLLRLIAGLLVPTSGRLSTLGRDPVHEATAIHRELGYMPQKFGLYEDLSVLENLTLHADLRNVTGKERRDTFERLLAFTDLQRFTGRFAGKLSGGMKQKLGLACALLGKPRLLLLDEPGVGVDPISRKELRHMVDRLVDDGIAVVWSTAYLEEAELCGTTLVLNEGQLIFSGSPQAMTAPLAGRCWHLKNPAGSKRRLLAQALSHPSISDGTIQGHHLRLTFRANAIAQFAEDLANGGGGGQDARATVARTSCPPPFFLSSPTAPPAGPGAAPAILWAPVEPRFEDAFIDRMGGGPSGDSVLAQHVPIIPNDRKIVIEAHQLTKKFGDFTATDAVTFQVRRGEIYGLLGPNGAGKSTTFKMMCGLLTPSAGRATVVGLDLRHSGGRARQKLGYMAQKFSLYGNLSVRRNLEFFSGIYGLTGTQRRNKTATMAAIFHLEPFLDAKTDSLSLGFKQRLALACAVMHEPDILFLDEPTSGVDPVTRREFWSHINGLVERGVTVMVTTHFMDEAEYCDRIGLVYRGKLIAEGTPDQLKNLAVATTSITADAEPTMEDAFIALIQGTDEHPE
ncbi:MAG: ABC transporter ATP-binding protein [Verrucomicrobia bacterium]|nr:MAG: ABC transporter ATP-binding protein [Verrucomicrobiota bacterium]